MPAADHTEKVHVDHSDASRLSAGGEESMGQFSVIISASPGSILGATQQEIVNRLYTFNISIDDQEFRNRVDRWARLADRWDEPVEDIAFFQRVAAED